MAWLCFNLAAPGREAADYGVQIDVTTRIHPPAITLRWPSDSEGNTVEYQVSRKAPEGTSWEVLATLGSARREFTDETVQIGNTYEYQVQRTATGYSGHGYVLAGIEAPAIEWRGRILLLVESSQAGPLHTELIRLQDDLTGDGWEVLRFDVPRTDSVESVKALIRSAYEADSASVRAVFLFGRIPVPYSGNVAPDGHVPDHQGAWPADVFYAELDGVWTDASVNTTKASSTRHHNVPGDGKYDQSLIPGAPELQLGRVDFSNMPALPLSETELLRRYLNKNHAFRHKLASPARRALIVDNFGAFGGEAFAASGWRNFTALLGSAGVERGAAGAFLDAMSSASWLLAFGCGSGSYTSASGIGATASLGTTPQAVFTLLFGSYFGDWDAPNNFLRAAIAGPESGLVSGWAGRPHWFLHHMALGETIGFSVLLTQKNPGLYKQVNYGGRFVHIALMGDPTLRLHPVPPPGDFSVSVTGRHVTLQWTAPSEPVLGYHVYRVEPGSPSFTRINPTRLTERVFLDDTAPTGLCRYMVRAETLENAASGSYYNLSQGVFAEGVVEPPNEPVTGGAQPVPDTSTVAPVIVSLTADATEMTEGSEGYARVTIRVDRPLDRDVELPLEFSGTAQAGVDYLILPERPRLLREASSTSFEVRPVWDYFIEPDEEIILTLSARDGILIEPGREAARIVLRDSPRGGRIKLRRH